MQDGWKPLPNHHTQQNYDDPTSAVHDSSNGTALEKRMVPVNPPVTMQNNLSSCVDGSQRRNEAGVHINAILLGKAPVFPSELNFGQVQHVLPEHELENNIFKNQVSLKMSLNACASSGTHPDNTLHCPASMETNEIRDHSVRPIENSATYDSTYQCTTESNNIPHIERGDLNSEELRQTDTDLPQYEAPNDSPAQCVGTNLRDSATLEHATIHVPVYDIQPKEHYQNSKPTNAYSTRQMPGQIICQM